jgi:hypoxanthine phosphoribosyltransferase
MIDDKLRLNWEKASDLSYNLANLIKNSGQHFNYMIVVPRGGYFVANIVARELNYGPDKLLHACVGSYDPGVGQQRDEFTVGDMPPANKVKGKRLLIIDEVCDTGDTLQYVTEYLEKAGAEKVSSGVLHYKPANARSEIQPDWIVYPWEEHELTESDEVGLTENIN